MTLHDHVNTSGHPHISRNIMYTGTSLVKEWVIFPDEIFSVHEIHE